MRIASRASPSGSRLGAFTLVELLVVISIIALLLALLLPALGKARDEGRKAKCLANLKQIGAAVTMYIQDKGDQIPWVNPHPAASWRSQFVWGGFIAPEPDAYFGNNIDYVQHPAQARPLNAYLAPSAEGHAVIDVYICPGDRTRGFSVIGGPAYDSNPEDWQSSWKAAGNSYAINWWWMNFYRGQTWGVNDMPRYSDKMLHDLVGGPASRFIVIFESLLFPLLSDADMAGSGLAARGWHRKWAQHNVLFLDGHADTPFMDTRYPRGDTWTVWPSR